MTQTGQAAPEFRLPRNEGDILGLSDLVTRKVILYFYPKADTSGCTSEASDFTNHAQEFAQHNAVVVGVSKDSVRKLERFKTKHNLDVIFLSDEDSDVCEKYGVWVEKNMYGRTYMGIERATFLIDEAGVIEKIWRKVRVKGHADEVLETVKSL